MTDFENDSRANPENAEFWAARDALAQALTLLAPLGADDVGEALSSIGGSELSPVFVAQVLMNTLPIPDMRLTVENKVFWLQVAEHMGPDWIAQLRRAAAFMDKADQF